MSVAIHPGGAAGGQSERIRPDLVEKRLEQRLWERSGGRARGDPPGPMVAEQGDLARHSHAEEEKPTRTIPWR